MMIKSLNKDLMDTLPTDLLLLVDGHTSYVEETLLAYSSKYQQGVEPETWKCFLQHRHRNYDKYDRMFLWENPVVEMLKYAIVENDYKAFDILINTLNINILQVQVDILSSIIQHDNKKMFELYSKIVKNIELSKIFYLIVPFESHRILSMFIDSINLESLKTRESCLAIVASNFDELFIRKLLKTNNNFKNAHIMDFFEYITRTHTDPENIIKIIDIMNCNSDERLEILMIAMSNGNKSLIKILLATYDYSMIFDILFSYATTYDVNNCNGVEMLRFFNEINYIDDVQLIHIYKLFLEEYEKQNRQNYFCTLEDYKWLTNKYIKVDPELDLLYYNDTILRLYIYKHFGEKKLAAHILNQYPNLPLDKIENLIGFIDNSVFITLYNRHKINIYGEQLLKYISLKVFKIIYDKLSLEMINQVAHQILITLCQHKVRHPDKLLEFIEFTTNNNIAIDYQLVMEVLLSCGTIVYTDDHYYYGNDNMIEYLKILKQHGKIKDHHRLLKVIQANKYKRTYRYLSRIVYSEPDYGYIENEN